MKKIKIIFVMTMVFVLCFCQSHIELQAASPTETIDQKLDRLNLSQVDKLMIVAHPDDETIWGGSHLLDRHYLVVCLTNGYNKKRAREFNAVIHMSGNQGLILNYPDKVNGKRSNWKGLKPRIRKDIQTILDKKDFKWVVTHNPKGEYGHIHHKMTSKIVTQVMKKDTDKLYYFGRYYKKVDLPEHLRSISGKKAKQKDRLVQNYDSQAKVMDHLGHMLNHENWVQYKDWRK